MKKTSVKSVPKKGKSKKSLPWRKNQKKWTDTLFDKRLLQNPALMTSAELAKAIEEYLEWHKGIGKYDWKDDPIEEGAEIEMPFSGSTWGRLLCEAMARLRIFGDLNCGRFKNNPKGK